MTNTTYLASIGALVLYSWSFTGFKHTNLKPDQTQSTHTVVVHEGLKKLDNVNDHWKENTDLKEVKKPVRKFMSKNPNIEQFTESCSSIDACEEFYYVAKSYTSAFSAKEVMQTLINTKPQNLWVGRSRFQLSYEPQADQIYTLADDAPVVSEDMIIALNLKIFGVTSIPVVFKILTIDEENNMIEFSYVEQNKNHGVQAIHISDNSEGGSTILHESRFFSGKKFRDQRLYPWIHNKLTDGFYKNLELLTEERFSTSEEDTVISPAVDNASIEP